ncbi:MAG: dockerin type I domain-containing protein, partial [Candidatus Omnitrophota bacterium]
ANWYNDTNGYFRFFAVFDDPYYKPQGDYFYTRKVVGYSSVDPTENSVTLSAPWNNGIVPAGTLISNTREGATYIYLAAGAMNAPTQWTSISGSITGMDITGANSGKFRPGTVYVKFVVYANYGQDNTFTVRLDNISFKEILDTGTLDIYVAHDGNDAWSGQYPQAQNGDGPVASMEAALNLIKIGYGFVPVNINFRGGTYRLTKTVSFSGTQTGSAQKPVVFKPYNNEKVILSGAQPVTSSWTPWANKPSVFLTDVSGIVSKYGAFTSLFVNGRRAVRARAPNTGFYMIKSVDPDTSISAFHFNGADINPAWHDLRNVEVVSYRRWLESRFCIDRIEADNVFFQGNLGIDGVSRSSFESSFTNGGAIFDWLMQNGYFNQTTGVAGVPKLLNDDARVRLNLAYPADAPRILTTLRAAFHGYDWDYTSGTGRYYVENVLEALDSAGEWYLDQVDNKLYYWPLPGEDLATAAIEAPVLSTYLSITGASYFEFKDLEWSYGAWFLPPTGDPSIWASTAAGVLQATGNHVTVDHNNFHSLGVTAILSSSCNDCNFVRNIFEDLGAAAINFTGNTNEISDNRIETIGRIYQPAAGLGVRGEGNLISHNEISDGFYSGIILAQMFYPDSVLHAPNIVEFNHVHHVMKRLNDGASIYVSGGGPGAVPNPSRVIIRNNFIHDNIMTDQTYAGLIIGLYLDERSMEAKIYNNVVYSCGTSLLLHMAHGNELTNNIFAGALNSTQLQFFGTDPLLTAAKIPGNNFQRNIIYSDHDLQVVAHSNNSMTTSDYNIYYKTYPNARNWNLPWWHSLGFDLHDIEADPGFVDPGNHHFTLRSDALALKPIAEGGIGFVNIDLSTVGPRDSVLGPGDVSGDGRVTMYDAALVLKYAVGGPLATTQQAQADVNGDRTIDAADAMSIARRSLGL